MRLLCRLMYIVDPRHRPNLAFYFYPRHVCISVLCTQSFSFSQIKLGLPFQNLCVQFGTGLRGGVDGEVYFAIVCHGSTDRRGWVVPCLSGKKQIPRMRLGRWRRRRRCAPSSLKQKNGCVFLSVVGARLSYLSEKSVGGLSRFHRLGALPRACLPFLRMSTKVLQICTYQLVGSTRPGSDDCCSGWEITFWLI